MDLKKDEMILESVSLGIGELKLFLDPISKSFDGIITSRNSKLSDLLGIESKDLKNHKLQNLFSSLFMEFRSDSLNIFISEEDEYCFEYFNQRNSLWLEIQFKKISNLEYLILISDITKFKNREQETKIFQNLSKSLYVVLDLNGNFTKIEYINPELDVSDSDFLGYNFSDFLHHEDRKDFLQVFEDIHNKRETIITHYRMYFKNSNMQYYEWRFVRKENRIYALANDISNTIFTENILKSNEENFRSFFENVDDLIFIANESGEIFYTNPAVSRKLGYREEEIKSMQILDMHPEEKREEAKLIFSAMFAGQLDHCPLPLSRKDKSLLPVETRVWFGKWDKKDSVFGISKDLTHEHESLERLSKIFDKNPTYMMIVSHSDEICLDVNSSFLDNLGYKKEEVLGKKIKELGIFLEPEKLSFQNSSQIHSELYSEIVLIAKNGKRKTAIYSGDTIESQTKKYLLIVLLDITAKKLAESNLKEERDLFSSGPIITLEWENTENRPITYISSNVKNILGYTDFEICKYKYNLLNLIHPDDINRINSEFNYYINLDVEGFEQTYRIQNSSGEYRWYYDYTKIIRDNDGQVLKLRGYLLDQTHQKSVERELIVQSELQKLMIEIASFFINIPLNDIDKTIIDALGKMASFVNADRAYIFEYNWDENTCRNTYEWCEKDINSEIENLQNVPNDMLIQWVESHKKGKTMYIKDVLSLAPDDTIRAVLEPQQIKSLIAVPMMEGKACVGFVGFDSVKQNHEYSEDEKKLLTVFSLMIVNIEKRKKLMEELHEAIEIAEAASKSKSEFLANMSHEIRTPLNAVIGFTELLKDTPLSTVQKQFVKNANIAGHSLLGIISDILDFSKIEAGMMELEIIRTDIIDIFENAIDLIKPSKGNKDIEILLNIDINVPRFAFIDPIRLKQIITNLLGNAMKFTLKGEIELKVIFEKESESMGVFKISVRDTGIGISEVQKDKLFKAFGQADTSTTRKFGGTGLGLIISEMIAKRMNSKINFTSLENEGTCFYFDIKCKYENGDKNNKLSTNSIKNCLVIDDNSNNLLILNYLLAKLGIDVSESSNGKEGLEILKSKGTFDLIICDYYMPEMDGLKVIQTIREEMKLNEESQPILLLHSSSDDLSVHQKFNQLGVSHLLTKPIKRDELYEKLSHIGEIYKEKKTDKGNGVKIPGEELNTKPLKLLIVEDVEMNLILLKAILRKMKLNLEVREARNGIEAVRQFQEFEPDLILMDIQMPEMSGIEATQKIREMESKTGKRVPIVALTAGALLEEKEKSEAAGMDKFLTKPIEAEKLRLVIQNYFEIE
ncbi:MAG: response regulator [Leptospiraceae bacterium]|nr:response regulator [Leptospiraceae bacterium]